MSETAKPSTQQKNKEKPKAPRKRVPNTFFEVDTETGLVYLREDYLKGLTQ